MFSSGDLNTLFDQIVSRLSCETSDSARETPAKTKQGDKKQAPVLTPQKALVILGLLAGVLEVKSVLIDRDQIINILLDGSLKRKTRLDKMLDEIGNMPFEEVLTAIIGRACD